MVKNVTFLVTYNDAVRDFCLVSNPDYSLQELNENHVYVLVLFDLIDLCHHSKVVHISYLLRTEILTQAIGSEDAVVKFGERHELRRTW